MMVNFKTLKLAGVVDRAGSGFSLLELMVVLAVSLLVGSYAYPSLSQQYLKWQLFNDADKLFYLLKNARVEALSKSVNITVCPSANGKECSKDWSNPIIGFIDPNKRLQLVNSKQLLFSGKAYDNLTSNRHSLHFSAIHLASNSAASLRFCSSDNNSRWRRAIIISTLGRVRIEVNPVKIEC